jgi:hypothetical protein
VANSPLLRKSVRALFDHVGPLPPWRRGYFWYVATARRQRPLRRRLASTLAPPGVFIRARKPCLRRRRVLWGWYVRFMVAGKGAQLSTGHWPRQGHGPVGSSLDTPPLSEKFRAVRPPKTRRLPGASFTLDFG